MGNFFSIKTIKNAATHTASWMFDPLGSALGLKSTGTLAVSSILEPWNLGSRQMDVWKSDWSKIKHWITPDMRRDREQMTTASVTPRRIVYGSARVSGQIAYFETSGASNETLNMIMILTGHSVHSFGDIYLDDKPLSNFGAFVEVKLYDGTQVSACSEMVAASAANPVTTNKNITGSLTIGSNKVTAMSDTNGLFVGMVVSDPVITTFTGNSTLNSNRIENILSVEGLTIGLNILINGIYAREIISVGGNYIDLNTEIGETVVVSFDTPVSGAIPSNTVITSIGRNFVELDKNATATKTNVSVNFNGTAQRWTTDHKILGCSYIYLKLTYSESLFPSGIPKVAVVVNGKKVYDPRTTTTYFSNNPALCIRDYMLLDEALGGMGCDTDEIDETSIINAANICDEAVIANLAEDVYDLRYTCNGTVTLENTPKQIMESLLQSMLGTAVYTEGVWKIYAATYLTPVATIDESWLNGAISFNAGSNKNDRCNTIKGNFVDPSDSWAVKEFPILINETYKTEDGEELLNEISLNFTTSSVMAQRIAKIVMERSRLGMNVTYPCNFKATKLETNDNVYINNALLGWVNKVFKVVDYSFSHEGGIVLNLTEEASTVYDWSGADILEAYHIPATTLPNPFTVAVPNTISFSNKVYDFNAGKDTRMDVTVSWVAGEVGNLRYELKYYNSDLDEWSDVVYTKDTSFTFIGMASYNYVFNIRAVNSFGKESSWVASTFFVPNTDTIVPDVTGLEIFNQALDGTFTGKDILLRWHRVTPRGTVEAYGPAGETKPPAWFRYYELLIYTNADVLLRTEYLSEEMYTYTHEKNTADNAGIAARTIKFKLRALSVWGVYSTNYATLTAVNPAPSAITTLTVSSFYNGYKVVFEPVTDIDGPITYLIHEGTASNFTPAEGNLINRGPETSLAIKGDGTTTAKYIKVAAVDAFGEDELNYSTAVSINPALIVTGDVFTDAITEKVSANIASDTTLIDVTSAVPPSYSLTDDNSYAILEASIDINAGENVYIDLHSVFTLVSVLFDPGATTDDYFAFLYYETSLEPGVWNNVGHSAYQKFITGTEYFIQRSLLNRLNFSNNVESDPFIVNYAIVFRALNGYSVDRLKVIVNSNSFLTLTKLKK